MSIRRRPTAATLVAIVTTLAIGSQTGLAAGSSQSGRSAPDPVSSVDVSATDSSSVTITWPASRDNDVAGYTVYTNGARVGMQTPDQARPSRGRDSFSYTIGQLTCGTSYMVGVDTFDRRDRHSQPTVTTVSTAACPDTAAPSAPTGMRQVAATESSVILAWSPSADNVGVVEYGLYAAGVRVATSSDASATLTGLSCGKSYLIALDAADAAGNRSAQTSSFFKTSGCPSTNKPPTTPTVVKVTNATDSSVALSWTASTDDVGVTGYGLYLSGSRTSETSGTSGEFTGLKCGTTYALGVDAKDAGGLRSTVATLSTATSPCTPTTPPPPSSTGSVTQTIANGSTIAGIVNWRAVYDQNGDGSEDDPGKIEFLIDSKLVLSEQLIPFGDSFADGSYTVGNGQHTFQVRALSDSGTLLASNTVTATVATQTTPPPPPSSTGSVTQTIANGSTIAGIVNWRAVYDQNGDGSEDDPGKIEFLIDSKLVLSEQLIPFGDSFADGSYTVGNGQHTFQVRALSDSGTLLASNTVTATVATQTTPPPNSSGDNVAPSQPDNLKVTSASATNLGVAWSPATDNVGVTGYGVYRGSTLTGTTPGTTATLGGLTCGNAYQVGVDAFDAAGNTSPPANMAVTTSPCPDSQPPTAPTNVTASTRTTTSIALTWAPATDNTGVAGYGIYNAGELVNTTTGTTGIVSNLTCATNYTLAVDAFDATGNSSTKTTVMVSTQPCTDTTPPTVTLTSPTSSSTITATVNTSANAADNVGVARVDFFRDGVSSGSDTSSPYTIPLDTTTIANGSHTLSARAYDSAGNVGNAAPVTVTVSNTTPPPPSSTGTVTQTIANGSSIPGITNWRAVYDQNGDGTEDDPGKIEFRVDGNLVLSEQQIPFGDSFADGSITVSNGSHTFQVRAISDSGTLLATNTVTATVAAQTTPPPPPPSPTGFPDAGNTGVPSGTNLTAYTGPSNITTAGMVIDGKSMGCIDVNAANVVIRNSRISCNGASYYAVEIQSNSASVRIEDSEITCQSTNSNGAGRMNITLVRVEITNCENGLSVAHDVTVQDSYIHDLFMGNGAHADGMQFESAASYVTIRHNTIFGMGSNGEFGTSAFIADLSGHHDWMIENNLFGGGAYTVYCVLGKGTNWVIRNNAFTTRFNSKGGAFGFATQCSDETQSGNYIYETGQPLTLG